MTQEVSSTTALPYELFPERDFSIRKFCVDFSSSSVSPDTAQGFFDAVWQIGYRAAMRLQPKNDDFCEEVASGTVLRIFEAITKGDFIPYNDVPTACYISNAARFDGFHRITRDTVRVKHEIHDEFEIFPKSKTRSENRPTENAVETKLFIEEIVFHVENDLTPAQQQVMKPLLEGYSIKEISSLLHISDHEVSARLYRAREILRKFLE